VLAEQATNEPNRLIASSIGVARPSEKAQYGYLSEHHCFGLTEEISGDYAEDLAASMLATTLGIEFDENVHWDERKELWKINNQIYKTANITQSAIGDKRGYWTTVVASAVFVP
jgi:arginine decarboxylase